jgi:hypothetical protein
MPAPPLPQVLAARKLHAYCRHSGRPVEAATVAAGGVHMLIIMLDSLDRTLRDLCTRILTDLAADDAVRYVCGTLNVVGRYRLPPAVLVLCHHWLPVE